MNTIEEIIEWIENYKNPSGNIEKFAYELGEMLKDMDYTQYADVFNVNIPDGFVAVGTYYDRLQGMGVNLLTDEQLIDKYSFLEGADNEIMNTVKIAEYCGDNYINKIRKLKGIFGRNYLCSLQGILNEKIVEIVINCVAVIHYSLGVTALA